MYQAQILPNGKAPSAKSTKTRFVEIIWIWIFSPIAIKNPREGTRSPRTGHELKRNYEMMEGSRGHPAREAVPYEGKAGV